MVQAFPKAKFCVFEPNPDLIPRLQTLFSTKPNVMITPAALSNENGSAALHFSSECTLTGSLIGTQSPHSCEVQLLRGDAFLEEHPTMNPSLIKIDVEGHEVEVFRGCEQLIGRYQPTIVFEHLFLTAEAIQSIVPSGYELFYIHDKSGECTTNLDRRTSHNALLIPKAVPSRPPL